MNQKFAFFIALLLAGFSLAGCQETPKTTGAVTVDAAANGDEVSLPLDQLLIVQLQANPSTGYGWGVLECDLSVLKPLGDPEFITTQADKQKVGAGGWEVFRFQPQAEGQTHLKMGYRRPWETDVAPEETFEIDVIVR